MVWVPYTKTNGQWIASKILQGFFGAPIESLCEISVTDLVSPELSQAKGRPDDPVLVLYTRERQLRCFVWLRAAE